MLSVIPDGCLIYHAIKMISLREEQELILVASMNSKLKVSMYAISEK